MLSLKEDFYMKLRLVIIFLGDSSRVVEYMYLSSLALYFI